MVVVALIGAALLAPARSDEPVNDIITAIDAKTGVVTAKETATGRAFQFQVKDAALLKSLKVGQKISADLNAMTVTMPAVRPGSKAVQLRITKAEPGGRLASPPAAASQRAERLVSSAPSSQQATDAAATTALNFPLKDLRISDVENTYQGTYYMSGGNIASGIVELHQAPPSSGLIVALASSNTDLATVPAQVTVTGGVASAETGPLYMARFDITTLAVSLGAPVNITARAGGQALRASLMINPPTLKSATLVPPLNCDGHHKATIKFELTGPAPSGGIRLFANLRVSYSETTGSGATASGNSEASGGKSFPEGTRLGSLRVDLPHCGYPGYEGSCAINGATSAKLLANDHGAGSKGFYSGCNAPD
jgi:hypothetical protein